MKLRIKDWDKHFENASSRKLKRLDWVAFPIKTDGEGYTALVENPETAAAFFGAWCAIVEIAARQNPRGYLPGGIPQDVGGICQSLGRMSRLPPKCFSDVLHKLIEIEWLEQIPSNEQVSSKLGESANAVGESANALGNCVSTLQDITGQGTTHTQRACVRDALPTLRQPTADDLNGQTSARFEDWFSIWAAVRGNAYRSQACQQYLSVVLLTRESDAMACAQSYVSGPGADPGHGYRPDNFLREMAGDSFKTRWPTQPRGPQRQETATESAIRKAKEAKNGTR